MSVPYKNHIIVGGYFFEELIMGNITLTCSTSNNVYIGYLKDDEWLSSRVLPQDSGDVVFPNPFSHSMHLTHKEDILNMKVYNSSSVLIESFNTDDMPSILGNDWPKGMYFIKLISKNGHMTSQKAIKI